MRRIDERLADGGEAVVFRSCLWQTNATLLRTPGGVVLFDPCYYPEEVEAIAAETAPMKGERRLVFTHSDWDHIVGYPRYSQWTTVAHERVAAKTVEQQATILGEIRTFDGKWYVPREEPPMYPRIDQAIAAADEPVEVDLAGERALVLHTPGHTDDAMATFFPRWRLVVAGDLLSALEFPFIYHSASAYRQTLDRVSGLVEELSIETLIPGHGPAAHGRAEIQQRLALDTDYLDRLSSAVQEAVSRGLDGADLQHSLAEYRYRGEPINPHIAEFHAGNIAIMEREARDPS